MSKITGWLFCYLWILPCLIHRQVYPYRCRRRIFPGSLMSLLPGLWDGVDGSRFFCFSPNWGRVLTCELTQILRSNFHRTLRSSWSSECHLSSFHSHIEMNSFHFEQWLWSCKELIFFFCICHAPVQSYLCISEKPRVLFYTWGGGWVLGVRW